MSPLPADLCSPFILIQFPIRPVQGSRQGIFLILQQIITGADVQRIRQLFLLLPFPEKHPERFQKLIDEYPEKYGKCTTTDGGVAVSILGPAPEDAPEHGHVQNTDFSWFTMNDSGYMLTVINMTDVKYYCWYRQ